MLEKAKIPVPVASPDGWLCCGLSFPSEASRKLGERKDEGMQWPPVFSCS